MFSNASTKAQQTEAVRRLVLASRTAQGMTILVTHQVNITALTNVVPASGESVVLRAKGQTIEVVGQLQTPSILHLANNPLHDLHSSHCLPAKQSQKRHIEKNVGITRPIDSFLH